MFPLVLSLIIFSILILFIYQSVSFKIKYTDEIVLEVSFLFFSLFIFPARSKRKKRRKRIKSKLIKIASAKKALEFFLSRSDVRINEFIIDIQADNPASRVIYNRSVDALVSAAVTYIYLKARTVLTKALPNTEKSLIDISIDTTLLSVILTFFLFLFEFIKKRSRKIVRS